VSNGDGVYTNKPGKLRSELKPAADIFAQGLTNFANKGPAETYAQGVPGLSGTSLEAISALSSTQPSQSTQFFQNQLGYQGIPEEVQNAVLNPVRDRVTSQFELAGRGGSPAQGVAQTEAEIRAMLPLVNSERDRQFSAAQNLAPAEQQGMRNNLLAGGILDSQAQLVSAEERRVFEQQQQEEYNQLQRTGGLLSQGSAIFSPGTGVVKPK